MADDRDPLSLLADDSSSSESEEETENIGGKKSLTDKSYYTSTSTSEKLPSPDTLFATVTQPQFLSTHIKSYQVNWDKLAKNIDLPSDNNVHTTGSYAAIPPPPDITQHRDTSSEISAAPVKYSIEESVTTEPKMLTVSSTEADDVKPGDKRTKDTIDKKAPSSKKVKGELFREKEKRKRDLGMASRDKNFVEEEKRILREQYKS